jgi:hypothetical protein
VYISVVLLVLFTGNSEGNLNPNGSRLKGTSAIEKGNLEIKKSISEIKKGIAEEKRYIRR